MTEPEDNGAEYPEDLAGFVADQRARAAYNLARDLPNEAASVKTAILEAHTPRQASAAKQRALAFAIMLDKLDQLVKPGGVSRYGRQQHGGDSDSPLYPTLD